MITITFNRRTLAISTQEERALRILRNTGWTAPKSHFEEGPRKYRRYILPSLRHPYIDGAYRTSRGELLGVSETARKASERCRSLEMADSTPKRATAFFSANPRHQYCIAGNPRRINAILQAIDTIRAARV